MKMNANRQFSKIRYDYFYSTSVKNTITPIMVTNEVIKPNTVISVKVNSFLSVHYTRRRHNINSFLRKKSALEYR